ncbi:hypothetical protein ACS0TY_023059 [Phlomoides rotata]
MQHAEIPASSVKADVTRASGTGSQDPRWQEQSTSQSKNVNFRKGDRVKYVGSLQSIQNSNW